MNDARFDTVSQFFAQRRLARRQVIVQGGAGLTAASVTATSRVAASAQAATPDPGEPDAPNGPEMLFVQSFQSGSIVPKEGVDGRYTVTLEHGLGQTIYFSDRPDRIVGTNPTDQFLAGLGFPDDNPPNAALVVESSPGVTDIAVVELFAPSYDPAGPTVTYEMAVLGNWESSTELGVTAAPTDLAAIEPAFGAAHLFIDDCPDGTIECKPGGIWGDRNGPTVGTIPNRGDGGHDGFCYGWAAVACMPCEPWYGSIEDMTYYWADQCNARFPDCQGDCGVYGVCTTGWCQLD